MGIIMFGVILITGTMALLMGAPFLYYLRHDQEWLNADNKTLELWYR